MLNQSLLEILVCPETKQKLRLLTDAELKLFKENVASFEPNDTALKNVHGNIDQILVREDRKYGYPISNEIPIMLLAKRIDLSKIL